MLKFFLMAHLTYENPVGFVPKQNLDFWFFWDTLMYIPVRGKYLRWVSLVYASNNLHITDRCATWCHWTMVRWDWLLVTIWSQPFAAFVTGQLDLLWDPGITLFPIMVKPTLSIQQSRQIDPKVTKCSRWGTAMSSNHQQCLLKVQFYFQRRNNFFVGSIL